MTDERYMRPGVEFAVAKLNEECGELVSAIGKTMRWGFASFDPTKHERDRQTNEGWIFAEMRDVEDAIRRLRHEVSKTTPAQRAAMFGYGNTDSRP